MKSNTGRMMAMVAVLVAGIVLGFASPAPLGVRGLKAERDPLKVKYGTHVYSFWKVGEDLVPWDETAGRLPDFLTLKRVVFIHEMNHFTIKVPPVELSAMSLVETELDRLARDCSETVETFQWILDTSKGGFQEALEAGGISDRKQLADLVAKVTAFQGQHQMDVTQFQAAIDRVGKAAHRLAAASRKFRAELAATRPFETGKGTRRVLDYKNDVLGPKTVIRHLDEALAELTAATAEFDQAVQAFFPGSVAGKEFADVPLPSSIPALNRAMATLYVLHQKDMTGKLAAAMQRVRKVADQARATLQALRRSEHEATLRAERARSLVAGWVDQRLADCRRFLAASDQVEKNFAKLQMDPGALFYRDEREHIRGLVDQVDRVMATDPSKALRLALRAQGEMAELKQALVLPGEHVRALQGKIERLAGKVDEETRIRARQNMDKALAAFSRRDAIEALTALAVTTDALAAGAKVPMVSALTGEPMVDKDDMQITIVPPPVDDQFQNPWFLGLVSAALLFPLLVLLYVARRLAVRNGATREETTMGIPEEATRTA